MYSFIVDNFFYNYLITPSLKEYFELRFQFQIIVEWNAASTTEVRAKYITWIPFFFKSI